MKIPANGSYRYWLREASDRAYPDSGQRLEGTFLSGAIFSAGCARRGNLTRD